MNMQKDEQNLFAVFSARQFGHWSGNNSLIDVATRAPPHTKWQSSRLILRRRVLGFTWCDDVGPASGSGLPQDVCGQKFHHLPCINQPYVRLISILASVKNRKMQQIALSSYIFTNMTSSPFPVTKNTTPNRWFFNETRLQHPKSYPTIYRTIISLGDHIQMTQAECTGVIGVQYGGHRWWQKMVSSWRLKLWLMISASLGTLNNTHDRFFGNELSRHTYTIAMWHQI